MSKLLEESNHPRQRSVFYTVKSILECIFHAQCQLLSCCIITLPRTKSFFPPIPLSLSVSLFLFLQSPGNAPLSPASMGFASSPSDQCCAILKSCIFSLLLSAIGLAEASIHIYDRDPFREVGNALLLSGGSEGITANEHLGRSYIR